LIVGLIGAMASAALLAGFEDRLTQHVELAFFLPAIVYMADAVGTQTETLAIRGLSVGVAIRRIYAKELATGVLIGALIATCFLPFALLLWDDLSVAVTVSLALLASCAVASAVALALPSAFHRMGRDPAFGSGPLATVVQDLLSLVIYLGIATVLVS
jgi:magnesium transporter